MQYNCEQHTINLPDQTPNFEAPSALGTINQLLSVNIGKKAAFTISMFDGSTVTHTGTIYYVANSYVLLQNDCSFVAVDIFSFKYVCFY